MAQPSIQATTFDKIVRSVSAVKGRDVLAALTLVLLFFCFWLALIFTIGILQWVLGILIVISLVGFAVFAVFMISQGRKDDNSTRAKRGE